MTPAPVADPVPATARIELERLVHRWQQLPLDRALPHVPRLRALAQRYADAVADHAGRPRVQLPDLGPAVLLEQLTVTLYDACRDGCAGPPGTAEAGLAEVRRALNGDRAGPARA